MPPARTRTPKTVETPLDPGVVDFDPQEEPEEPVDDKPVSSIASDNLLEFVELAKERRELEARLKAVKARQEKLETPLLDSFAKNETQNVRVAGITVYVHRQLWANPRDGDYDRAVQAMRKSGLGDLIQERFNTNTLSAYFRELDAQGEAATPAMEDAFVVNEVFSLRTRTR